MAFRIGQCHAAAFVDELEVKLVQTVIIYMSHPEVEETVCGNDAFTAAQRVLLKVGRVIAQIPAGYVDIIIR